jgi:hypothetical protein
MRFDKRQHAVMRCLVGRDDKSSSSVKRMPPEVSDDAAGSSADRDPCRKVQIASEPAV